jgi:cytochrome c-type biogenesis protein CcmE
LLAGTVLLGVGILVVVFRLSSPRAVYAHSVSEFVAQPIRDQPVRVSGTLVHGSLSRADNPCEYRFRLAGRESAFSDAGPLSPRPELSVRYAACVIPDTFRDLPGCDVEVMVEGELCANCHRFEATQVLSKCPGKYWIKRQGGPDCPCGMSASPAPSLAK